MNKYNVYYVLKDGRRSVITFPADSREEALDMFVTQTVKQLFSFGMNDIRLFDAVQVFGVED